MTVSVSVCACVCVSSILLIPQVSLSLCQERIWAEQTPHINEVIVEVPSAECCFKYWHRATWPCVLWQPINTARYVGMRGHYYSTCSSVGGCMWEEVERVREGVRDRHSFSDLPREVSLSLGVDSVTHIRPQTHTCIHTNRLVSCFLCPQIII